MRAPLVQVTSRTGESSFPNRSQTKSSHTKEEAIGGRRFLRVLKARKKESKQTVGVKIRGSAPLMGEQRSNANGRPDWARLESEDGTREPGGSKLKDSSSRNESAATNRGERELHAK